MSTIDEKRAAFHQYLASSGVISALSKALIKLYEEPNKPDDPINFVRRHMGSEDFFILGDGKVEREPNAEEELVLSSLIEKKSEETEDDIVEAENVSSVIENTQVLNEEDGNMDAGDVDGTDQSNDDEAVKEVDLLKVGFEALKSNEKCKSVLKTNLTDDIFDKIRNESNDGAAALYDCIKSGLENPNAILGIYATDLQFYGQLNEIFDPVIDAYHGFGKETIQPNCDWGDSSVFEPFDENNDSVVSIRICCSRNIQDYPLVCKMEESDLNDSLAKIKSIIDEFEDSSKGTFYTMADLTEDQETELKSIGAYMESSDKHLSSANVYQQWPIGRGVFVTDDKSIIIHVNGEDHVKFMSTESSKDFGKIYQRLVDTVGHFELSFARHDRLGWLTFSPSNLGTALNFTVDLKLPRLHANPDKLQDIVKNSPTQLKLSATGDESTYNLCNQSTMGSSEFELAKQLYDVIRAIIECENSEGE